MLQRKHLKIAVPAFFALWVLSMVFHLTSGNDAREAFKTTTLPTINAFLLGPIDEAETTEPFRLSEAEQATLTGLLAAADSASGARPKGIWDCYLTLELPEETITYRLSCTENNGTYLSLMSNGLDGWNHGRLRNDELKVFIEACFEARGLASKLR